MDTAGSQQPVTAHLTPAESRSRNKTILAVAGLIAVVLIALLARWGFQKPEQPRDLTTLPSPPARSSNVPQPVAQTPRLNLNYSILVQKFRNGKKFEGPFRLPGEILFESDYRIRLDVTAPQRGFLYILNEGPQSKQQMPEYVVLFPSPLSNNGSPEVSENQEVKIPENSWFVFDQEKGTEKLWIVFALKPVPDLEIVRGVVNVKEKGSITDPSQAGRVQSFLNNSARTKPESVKDAKHQQTTLSVKGEVLIHLLPLEHY